MALQTVQIPPLDPNGFTGPVRVMGGVGRSGSVTLDTPYGEDGRVEFARWLYVGTSGSISYVKWDGTTQVLAALAAGVWHPIFSIMVNTSGTSATGIAWGS